MRTCEVVAAVGASMSRLAVAARSLSGRLCTYWAQLWNVHAAKPAVMTLVLLTPSTLPAQPVQAYRLNGPSQVDVSACAIATPTDGVTTVKFWVIRAPNVAGPTQLSATNLPAGVQVSFTPAELTYPGWVIGQEVTAQVKSPAGAKIPDSVITLSAFDATNRADYEVLLHGACPRNSKSFTVRGSFHSNHLGTIFPVEGAIVEIYRDVPWALDPWVARTVTLADGSFEVNVWTTIEASYYAKLRLNDGAVSLRDNSTPEIMGYNSFKRASNRDSPLMDLGTTVISRDGGAGTPKTAIWQGARTAFLEFTQSAGTPPPTGDYEIVIQWTATQIIWTSRSTTNWEDGAQTYRWRNGSPTLPAPGGDPYLLNFDNYATNFHEFGHALRHTVDGDPRHNMDDASSYTYGRPHTLCEGSADGYIETEAYGFNEGWAHYWEQTPRNVIAGCSLDLTDLRQEGSVANDLLNLAETLNACLPILGSNEEVMRRQRKAMFDVLNRGQNIIHSQAEFRAQFALQYPTCALPAIGSTNNGPAPPPPPPPKPSKFHDIYRKEIDFRRLDVRRLDAEMNAANRESRRRRSCQAGSCDVLIASIVRPHVLLGQKRYTEILGRTLQAQYEEEKRRGGRPPELSEASVAKEAQRLAGVKEEVRKVSIAALQGAARSLDAQAANDRTGQLRAASKDLKRTARSLSLKSPENDEVFTILQLPAGPVGDRVSGR